MDNPRYVAYAKVHNKSPDEMLSHDKKRVAWWSHDRIYALDGRAKEGISRPIS